MKRLRFAPVAGIVTLAIYSSLVACSPQKSLPPPMYVHTVSVQGETLGLISDWYTGSSQNWRTIADNNPGLNPNRLRLGDQVMIPESMTTRTEPLTRKYVESANRRSTGAGDTFAKTTPADTLPIAAPDTTQAAGDGSNDPASASGVTPPSDAADSAAAAVRAAEEATAAANEATAKAAEASQEASAQGAESASADAAVEAAKQAQAAAEEEAQRASAAAADAAAKAAESANNTVAQASSDTAAAGTVISAPASDRPKSKDELLKELLEDK